MTFLNQIAPYLPYYPYILAGWMGLSLLLLLLAWFNVWRRRTATVWRNRHKADKRAQRLLMWSISNLIASVFVSILSGSIILAFGYTEEFFPPRNPYEDVSGVAVAVLPTQDPNMTPSATFTPSVTFTSSPITPSATPSPTPTPSPTLTMTPSRTPTPTRTLSPAPTFTTTATLSPLAQVGVTPPFTAQKVPEGAMLRVIAADDLITDTNTPDSPQTTFNPGIRRIYLFLSYTDLRDGISWGWVMYRNGIPVKGEAALWSRGSDGATVISLSAPTNDGYPIGDYEIRLYLNEQQVSAFPFTVAPAPID